MNNLNALIRAIPTSIRMDAFRRMTCACVIVPILGCLLLVVRAEAQETGTIRGVVTDATTGTLLEGAKVLTDGGASALTNRRGEFTLQNLPTGNRRLTATYTGMKDSTQEVTVAAGETAAAVIALQSDVVVMGAFSVVADRSADSVALTQQRNSLNIKNVVDIKSMGELANGNPAELLQLLPGISGQYFGSEVDRVSIRGISSELSTVSLDGNNLSRPDINVAGGNRTHILYTTSTNSIKTVEVTKALTPDQSADSVGGRVNLIQKSALDFSPSSRKFDYTISGQYVSPGSGFDGVIEPNIKLSYHTALGEDRNLGFYASAGYIGEQINNYYTISRVNATNPDQAGAPYPFLHIEAEGENIRVRKNGAVTLDFRPTKNFESALRFKYDTWFEEGAIYFSQIIFNSPRAGSPSGLHRYGGATVQDIVAPNPADVESYNLSWDAKYLWNDWTINGGLYDSRSVTKIDARNDKYGTVIAQFNPAGATFAYQLDRRTDPNFPRFNVIEGDPNAIYNLNNYTLPVYQQVNFYTDDERRGAKLDFEKTFQRSAMAFKLKAGADWRMQQRYRTQEIRTRSFVGADGVAGVNPVTGINDDALARFGLLTPPLPANAPNGNQHLPLLDILAVAKSFREERNFWTEDAFATAQNSLTGNFKVNEQITSGYVMGTAEWRKLQVLAGGRLEKTVVKGTGVRRNPVQATAAQIPDPIARAKNNFGGRITRKGSYDDFFPSVHAVYSVLPNAQMRASYATGIGRPPMSNLTSTTTIDINNRIVNSPNPNLNPQYVDNFDLAFEYYIEPAGVISVGLFRKDFNNFIIGTTGVVEPGTPGLEDYAGYELRSSKNDGSAEVEGIEFNYVQQLNIIPQKLGLFTLKANLTKLRTKGNYGTTTDVGDRVPGFTPLAWNLILDYKKGPLSAMVRYNYQDRSLVSRGADLRFDAYFSEREKVDVNLGYRLTRDLRLFCAIDNLTNKASIQNAGRNEPYYPWQTFDSQHRITFGLEGSF